MAIRLAITITAVPGKGAQLADGYKTRCAEVMKEPGCEQFEIFQSLVNPDRLLLLERWTGLRRLARQSHPPHKEVPHGPASHPHGPGA